MIFTESLGYRIFSDDLGTIPLSTGKCRTLFTISPNSYGIATKDEFFRESLRGCDYLVLDGTYFALASILINRKNIRKNQGLDVFYHFMKRLDQKGGSVFFLGSTPGTLQKIEKRINIDYPNVTVKYYSPPFRKEFSDEESAKMINEINSCEPDLLFIGMTCPKQEKWAFKYNDSLKAELVCCVGAVFDWYAGNEKEIAPIWWKLRLAWLIRTINRPEILKRYPNIMIFFRHLVLTLIGINKIPA